MELTPKLSVLEAQIIDQALESYNNILTIRMEDPCLPKAVRDILKKEEKNVFLVRNQYLRSMGLTALKLRELEA